MNKQNRKFVFNVLVLIFWGLLFSMAGYGIIKSFNKDWVDLIWCFLACCHFSYKLHKTYGKIEETFKED